MTPREFEWPRTVCHIKRGDSSLTPLELKLANAISDEIQRQGCVAMRTDDLIIDTDLIAQVCTKTIKTEMAAALRASAARREAEVNAAIDEVTK
jgi:hypothetical protein